MRCYVTFQTPDVTYKQIKFKSTCFIVIIAIIFVGLYNDNLFYQKDFDNGMSLLLNLFLQRQVAPVCLIAHNGHQFDFPLLKSELRRLGTDLPGEVLCADSLEAFKAIDGKASGSCNSLKYMPVLHSHDSNHGSDVIFKKHTTFTPVRIEASVNGKNAVNTGLPMPVFYNDQQVSNNVTPELQIGLESWKKEPPPAPCPKRCSTRINKIPPYEAEESDIKSVRKKLFVEKEKKVAEKATPPPMKGSETPLSVSARNRIECGQNHKVKKKLFGDGDRNTATTEEDKNCKNSQCHERMSPIKYNEQQNDTERSVSGSQTPTQDIREETQLYWGGDSIENPAVLMQIENWERQDSSWNAKIADTDMSDDVLLVAVLEAEEDEIQKNMLDMEMMTETQDGSSNKRPADLEDNYSANVMPSTSGISRFVKEDSPSPSKRQKLSYKLVELHKRVVGYAMQNEHRAEDDCLALVRIFHRAFSKVCPWIDNHAISFTDVSPMFTSKLKTKPCLGPNEFPYQLT